MCDSNEGHERGHTFTRVFETEVRDGTQEFWLEEEVAETSRVDSDVGVEALGLAGGSIAVGGDRGGGGDGGGSLLGVLLVINEVLFDVGDRHGAGGGG